MGADKQRKAVHSHQVEANERSEKEWNALFLLDYDLCHRLTSPFDHPGRLHLIKSGLNQYTDK